MPTRPPGERLELFTGDMNNAAARVYARWQSAGTRLSGAVVGPHCLYSRTLSATIPFRDCGVGGRLAEAVVPDPCFWSPDLPFLYEAQIELHSDRQPTVSHRQMLALKPLGVRGGQLVYESKNWVPRAVDAAHVPAAGLESWRDAAAAMAVEKPAATLLEEASRRGIWIIAYVADLELALELARWPCVAIVVLPGPLPLDESARPRGAGVIFAVEMLAEDPALPAAGGDLVIIRGTSAAAIAQAAQGINGPRLARLDARYASIADARRACDTLQAELAASGPWAGYIV